MHMSNSNIVLKGASFHAPRVESLSSRVPVLNFYSQQLNSWRQPIIIFIHLETTPFFYFTWINIGPHRGRPISVVDGSVRGHNLQHIHVGNHRVIVVQHLMSSHYVLLHSIDRQCSVALSTPQLTFPSVCIRQNITKVIIRINKSREDWSKNV